jgi:hypothetical protein
MTSRRTTSDLIQALSATREETLSYFSLGANDLGRTYGPGKWSVRFVLHHLADSETVLHDRICRTLSEPRQTMRVFDQAEWAASLDYSQVPLELSAAVYDAVRRKMIHYAGRFYETHGHLEFVHSETGVRTLRQEFDKVADHNAHHLAQIRLALGAEELAK